MRGERADLAGDQVAGDDTGGVAVVQHEVEHLRALEQLDGSEVHLAGERLVRAQQQLLPRLTTGIERAGDLGAAERSVVEEPAVLACEGNPLRDALVDDVHADLREPVDVGLTRPVVAALHGVVEETVHAVAVVLVVLRGVDAALRGDAVRATRRVVERQQLHPIAELAQRCRRRRAGQPAAHHHDLVATLVGGVHQLHSEAVVVPLLRDRPVGDPGVEAPDHLVTTPVVMSNGMLTLPTVITAANPTAK